MAESPVVKTIRAKVEGLIADNRRLRDDYDKVAAQKDKLRAQNRDLTDRIAELEKRVAVLELAEGMTGGSDNKKARVRVNRLMREVDKCIALLNR